MDLQELDKAYNFASISKSLPSYIMISTPIGFVEISLGDTYVDGVKANQEQLQKIQNYLQNKMK